MRPYAVTNGGARHVNRRSALIGAAFPCPRTNRLRPSYGDVEAPRKWELLRPHDSEEPSMQTITTIGLDIAKSIFQVHGVDADGPFFGAAH